MLTGMKRRLSIWRVLSAAFLLSQMLLAGCVSTAPIEVFGVYTYKTHPKWYDDEYRYYTTSELNTGTTRRTRKKARICDFTDAGSTVVLYADTTGLVLDCAAFHHQLTSVMHELFPEVRDWQIHLVFMTASNKYRSATVSTRQMPRIFEIAIPLADAERANTLHNMVLFHEMYHVLSQYHRDQPGLTEFADDPRAFLAEEILARVMEDCAALILDVDLRSDMMEFKFGGASGPVTDPGAISAGLIEMIKAGREEALTPAASWFAMRILHEVRARENGDFRKDYLSTCLALKYQPADILEYIESL